MGDMGDFWRDVRAARADQRRQLGVACPECRHSLPRAQPSILLPGQRCRRHDYRDPRPAPQTSDPS